MFGRREATGATPVGAVNNDTKAVWVTPVQNVNRGASKKWENLYQSLFVCIVKEIFGRLKPIYLMAIILL